MKQLSIGIVIGFLFAGCAGLAFPYKYYGIDLKDGMLLGPDASSDYLLAVCAATATDKSPCVAMFTDQFLSLKQDYLNISNQLSACQQRLAEK